MGFLSDLYNRLKQVGNTTSNFVRQNPSPVSYVQNRMPQVRQQVQNVVRPTVSRISSIDQTVRNNPYYRGATNVMNTMSGLNATKNIFRDVGDIARDTARMGASARLTFQKRPPNMTPKPFTPTTRLQKLVYGNEPITAAQEGTISTGLQKWGVNPSTAKGISTAALMAGIVGNLTPMGEGKSKLVNELTKIDDVAKIKKLTGATDEIALKIAKSRDAKVIQKLLSPSKTVGGKVERLTTGNGMKVEISNTRPQTINVPIGNKPTPIEAKVFEHDGVTLALYNEKPLGGSHLYVLADPKTGATISSGQSEAGAILHAKMDDPAYWSQVKEALSPSTEGASKVVSLDRKLPQQAKEIATSIENKLPQVPVKPVVKSPNLVDNPKTASLAKSIVPNQIEVNNDPVQKITNLLKEAKPLSMEQRAQVNKLRKQQFAKMMSARGGTSGEKGYFAELGALKGGAKKVDFESIRPNLEQADIDNLFDRVNDANIGEWEKINAKSSLAKLLSKEGATIPTQNELKLLNDVFGSDFTKAILDKRSTWQKFMAGTEEALNLPRSLMASFDLSAPLRQGVFLVGRPKQWIPAFTSMFKQFGSEKAYRAIQESIQAMPNYKTMREARLALTDTSLMAGREEQFMSNLAERIPIIGKGVKASGRAYTGFLNKLRADTFNDLFNKAKALGQDSPEMASDIAKFVNSATGRGDLGKLNNAAVALNSVFFSPRLMASRVNLLNPAYYAQLNPMVRKEALKSLLTFGAVAGSVLGLAKAGGAEVGTDPRSADFGKIKVGDTRYDILGGFQQYVVLASRLITGKMVSSTTGKEISLTEGYKPTTRKDIIINFLQSKENPVLSYLTNFAEGTTALGEKFRPIPELIDRMIPMLAQDLVELSEDKGFAKAFGMTLPAFFGMGVQTYGKQIPNVNEKGKLEWRNPPTIGEKIYNKITGQQVSNLPKDQQDVLSGQRRIELQNKADIDKAKAQIMKSQGGATSVGDKVIYWDEENEQIKTTTKQKYNLMEFEKKNGSNDLIYSKYSLEADRLKDSKDYKGWMGKTEEYLKYYEQYIGQLEPDSKEYFTAVKRYENILQTAQKYASYGGFTKGKKGNITAIKSALKKASVSKISGKVSTPKMTIKNVAKVGVPTVKKPNVGGLDGKIRARISARAGQGASSKIGKLKGGTTIRA